MNEIKQFVDEFIRPRVQADGGEVVVDSINGDMLHLVLMGECAVCPGNCGVREWAATQVRERFGTQMQVIFSVKKRYFQDK